MKKVLLIVIFIVACFLANSQTNTFPTTGNVGIGTTSPTGKLHIVNAQGSVIFRSDASSIDFTRPGTNYYRATDASGSFAFITGSTGYSNIKLFISSEGNINMSNNLYVIGNLGVGTNTPSYKLDVLGNAKFGVDPNSKIYLGTVNGIPYIQGTGTNNQLAIYTNTERIRISENGNIGIGTTTPQAPLNVSSFGSTDGMFIQRWNYNNSPSYYLDLKQTVTSGVVRWNFSQVNNGIPYNNVLVIDRGKVGVGTTNPDETVSIAGVPSAYGKLSIVPELSTYSSYKLVLATQPAQEGFTMSMGGTKIISTYGYNVATEVGFGHKNSPNLLYLKGGNVGIGTTNPTAKLAVNGLIKAHEVKVTIDTGDWPDFVFSSNYQLRSLSEVEQFITENNHLPDVPNQAEVMENGVGLGEMNAILLQKIEELTLYVIELQKQVDKLKETQQNN